MKKMSGSDSRAYNKIFQHPIAHNLKWKEVYALFRHLGILEEEPNGNFKVTYNGKNLILRPSLNKDVSSVDELMTIRHFIQLAEIAPGPAIERERHWVVVMNHREIRIFRSDLPGTKPEMVMAQVPEEHFRNSHNSKEFPHGQKNPDPNSFFKPVADLLKSADRILIFGTATGNSCEMEHFIKWLEINCPETCEKIVGSLTVDEGHLSEAQILAKSREFYRPLTFAAA